MHCVAKTFQEEGLAAFYKSYWTTVSLPGLGRWRGCGGGGMHADEGSHAVASMEQVRCTHARCRMPCLLMYFPTCPAPCHPQLVMNVPYTALHFAVYESMKKFLVGGGAATAGAAAEAGPSGSTLLPSAAAQAAQAAAGGVAAPLELPGGEEEEEGLLVQLVAGGTAGGLAAAATTPLDVVKTRLQVGKGHVKGLSTNCAWSPCGCMRAAGPLPPAASPFDHGRVYALRWMLLPAGAAAGRISGSPVLPWAPTPPRSWRACTA